MYKRRKYDGKFAPSSYRSLNSGTSKNVEKNYKIPDLTKRYNDRFVPIEEGDGVGAPINLGTNLKGGNDKYDINAYLPQEEEKDWFETIEPMNVKNSHLINTYRPIGVNSIGSSHRLAIRDLRGIDKAVCS